MSEYAESLTALNNTSKNHSYICMVCMQSKLKFIDIIPLNQYVPSVLYVDLNFISKIITSQMQLWTLRHMETLKP